MWGPFQNVQLFGIVSSAVRRGSVPKRFSTDQDNVCDGKLVQFHVRETVDFFPDTFRPIPEAKVLVVSVVFSFSFVFQNTSEVMS